METEADIQPNAGLYFKGHCKLKGELLQELGGIPVFPEKVNHKIFVVLKGYLILCISLLMSREALPRLQN